MAMTLRDNQSDLGEWSYGDDDSVRLSRSGRIVRIVFLLLACGLVWAYFAELAEVSAGDGRVVPTSREQVIQSLEGGILAALHVREDEVVEPGQILAQLDPTKSESNVEESAAKYRAALAASSRLRAEVEQTPLAFPKELDGYPELIASETELYEARRRALEQSLEWVEESLALVRNELEINESLTAIGAASNVEVIRLKRQLVELELKKVEMNAEYVVRARGADQGECRGQFAFSGGQGPLRQPCAAYPSLAGAWHRQEHRGHDHRRRRPAQRQADGDHPAG